MPINRIPGPITNLPLSNTSALEPGDVSTATATEVLLSVSLESPKRITGVVSGLSADANDSFVLKLGTATGLVDTGYNGVRGRTENGGAGTDGTSTAWFELTDTVADTDIAWGLITMVNLTDNVWCYTSQLSTKSGQNEVYTSAGRVSLPGELTQWALSHDTTATFDAGIVSSIAEA